MKKNDLIELTIEDMSSDGAGIGRYQGMAFFVKDGEEISSIKEYETKVLSMNPGQTVDITVKRQGMDEYLEVTCAVAAGILQ